MSKYEPGRKVCRNCGRGYFHLPTADGNCGYCTKSGLIELKNYGIISPKQCDYYIKNLGRK